MKIDDIQLQFQYENKMYKTEIYYLDGDNYSIRLYDSSDKELFSTWIDSAGGEVTGNAEVYTMDDIDDLINKVYDFYNILIQANLLITGE